jgi:hypothetical protein
VQPARQRLEEFFMGLVAKAQAEQAATSGALQGGQTARFLGGGTDSATQAEGRALVEDLKRGEDRPVAASMTAAAPTVQQDVLAELSGVTSSKPASTQAPSAASAAPSAPAVPPASAKEATPKAAGNDVDRSIIEGLLGDQGDAPKGKQG